MSTTAVSFRKGTTEENNAFAGVAGEIVADLGQSKENTSKATIVLHTGDGLAGGIRMAREDMKNLTKESINNMASFEEHTEAGVYYGLARRNLSNYVSNNVNASTIESRLKSDYKIASTDAHDISTWVFADIRDSEKGEWDAKTQVPAGGPTLATQDLSNVKNWGKAQKACYDYWLTMVDTDFLATNGNKVTGDSSGHRGDDLAYANMKNVNTASLAEGTQHAGKNLAYSDLSNVGYQVIVDYIDNAYSAGGIKLVNYEWKDNKVSTINVNASSADLERQYPSVKAIINYTSNVSGNYANVNLNNITDWNIASEKEDVYRVDVTIDNGGTGYAITGSTSDIATNIAHPDGGVIRIKVLEVNSDGKILSAAVDTNQQYASESVATAPFIDTVNPGHAEFTISSTRVLAGRLMKCDFSNADIENSTGTQSGNIGYEIDQGSDGSVRSIESVTLELSDTTSQTEGFITTTLTDAGVASKMAASNTSSTATISQTTGTNLSNIAINKDEFEEAFTTTSGSYAFNFDGTNWLHDGQTAALSNYGISYTGTPASGNVLTVVYSGPKTTTITTTPATAYLNKNSNVEAHDTNHELLNRGEIVTYVSGEVQKAINTAISEAVVFKGVVEDQTKLPTTKQTNGDLYWVTKFVDPVPTGMIAGRSGSAIWNKNLTPAAWSYSQDDMNTPDDSTIKYTTTATAQQLSVKIAGPQSGVANALVVKSDGLYVKTQVEVPALPVLPNNGDTGVYHLYAKKVNGKMEYSWVNDSLLAVTGTN